MVNCFLIVTGPLLLYGHLNCRKVVQTQGLQPPLTLCDSVHTWPQTAAFMSHVDYMT